MNILTHATCEPLVKVETSKIRMNAVVVKVVQNYLEFQIFAAVATRNFERTIFYYFLYCKFLPERLMFFMNSMTGKKVNQTIWKRYVEKKFSNYEAFFHE